MRGENSMIDGGSAAWLMALTGATALLSAEARRTLVVKNRLVFAGRTAGPNVGPVLARVVLLTGRIVLVLIAPGIVGDRVL